MHNWSVDMKHLERFPAQAERFKFEQLINFGVGDTKLSRQTLKRLLPELSLDPAKKHYIEFLLAQ